ncbi:hypothetical protein LEN26_007608 [Aphanomyces euteiches]|nr:hypothetical protein LEN26_007608 [Aphanomyces euteiches]
MDEDTRNGLLLFTYTFGVGSLSMGHIFGSTGSILGSVMLYIFSACNLHASAVLCRCMAVVPTHVRTFGDLGFHVCGNVGRYIIVVSEALSCLTTPIAFLILAGTELLPNISAQFDTTQLTSTQWIIITAVCMLPLVYIPTLKETAALCIIGSISTLLTDTIALTVNLLDRPLTPRESQLSAANTFSAFGSIMFAFGSALLIPPLYRQCSLEGSQQLVSTVSTTLIYVTVLYMFIGILSYAQFGCMAPATLVANMPNGPWKILANGSMLVHIAIAYPVIMSPTLFVLERRIFGKDGDADILKEKLLRRDGNPTSSAAVHLVDSPKRDDDHQYDSVDASEAQESFVHDVLHDALSFTRTENVCRMVLRTLIVGGQCFFAIMLQTSFSDILTLIGATTVTLPCLIMSCVCFLGLFPSDGTCLGCAARLFSYFVIVLGAVLGIYSTIYAVHNIQDNWATYKMFQPYHPLPYVNGRVRYPSCRVGEQN